MFEIMPPKKMNSLRVVINDRVKFGLTVTQFIFNTKKDPIPYVKMITP